MKSCDYLFWCSENKRPTADSSLAHAVADGVCSVHTHSHTQRRLPTLLGPAGSPCRQPALRGFPDGTTEHASPEAAGAEQDIARTREGNTSRWRPRLQQLPPGTQSWELPGDEGARPSASYGSRDLEMSAVLRQHSCFCKRNNVRVEDREELCPRQRENKQQQVSLMSFSSCPAPLRRHIKGRQGIISPRQRACWSPLAQHRQN